MTEKGSEERGTLRLPRETPRGVFEYRVKAALSVAHMSPKVAFEVILLALRCYEEDSACGEVRS